MIYYFYLNWMDNRFQGSDSVENGGMFSREKIQTITQ